MNWFSESPSVLAWKTSSFRVKQYLTRLRSTNGHERPLTFILSPTRGEEVAFTFPSPRSGRGAGEEELSEQPQKEVVTPLGESLLAGLVGLLHNAKIVTKIPPTLGSSRQRRVYETPAQGVVEFGENTSRKSGEMREQ